MLRCYFPLASKSSMNFYNLKLPVQGKSQVFKPLHSSREMKAQKNTFIAREDKRDRKGIPYTHPIRISNSSRVIFRIGIKLPRALRGCFV